jgi:hypothetical protein
VFLRTFPPSGAFLKRKKQKLIFLRTFPFSTYLNPGSGIPLKRKNKKEHQ